MKKKMTYMLAITAVVIVIYNLIAFVAPFERTTGFWVEYAFSMIAILLFFGFTTVFCTKDIPIKSKFLDLPVFHVLYVLLAVQVCFGFVVMAQPAIPYQIALIVSAVALAFGLFLMFSIKLAEDEIQRVGKRVDSKVNFIREMSAKLEVGTQRVEDKSLLTDLKKLSEAIRFSDPMSSDELYEKEREIANKIDDLNQLISSADYDSSRRMIREIQALLKERNLKCKMMK